MEVATSGAWKKHKFGLAGGLGPNFNHAKLGVSTSNNVLPAINARLGMGLKSSSDVSRTVARTLIQSLESLPDYAGP